MSDSTLVRAAQVIDAALREGHDTLDLHGLGLKELPPLPSELRHVRRLNLSGNRLEELPAQLWEVEALEHLDLGSNRLRQLDAGVAKLRRLASLDLSENRLTTLPLELADCTHLTTLELFNNDLAELPPAILLLPDLVRLDLARNRLRSLPDLVGRFPRLEVLDVSANSIAELPTGFGALAALRVLNLSRNKLTSTADMATLPRLEELYLDDNVLVEIAAQLADLPLLRVLTARGNPVGELPRAFDRFAPSETQGMGDVLQRNTSGGYEPGVRYLDAPWHRFEFSIALREATTVNGSLDLYYKEFAGVRATLTFANRTVVDLTSLTRKAALELARENLQDAASVGATMEFKTTNQQQEVRQTHALAERTLARVAGAALVLNTPAEPAEGGSDASVRRGVKRGGTRRGGAGPPPPKRKAPQREESRRDTAPQIRRPASERRVPEVADAEPVDAAVFCPPQVAKASTFLVQVFLFPPSAAASVKEQALSADSAAQHRGTYSLPLELRPGTRVDVRLEMPTLSVEEPDAVLIWRGTQSAVQFEVSVPAGVAGPNSLGRVRFAIDGVPAGALRFQVTLAPEGTPVTSAEPRETQTVKYRRAFVSYSSKDRPEVLKRVQAFKIAGLSVFQDILDLEPGQRWEKELYREIDSSDVFLLFWSQAAAASPWVAKEIDYAIARKAGDDDHPPDIQPVPIEAPIPPPPEKLKHLHFNDALLAQIRAG